MAKIIVAALMVAASLGIFLWVFRLSYWAKPPRLSTYTLSISEYPGPGDACCREPQPCASPATGEPSSPRRRPGPQPPSPSPRLGPLCLPGQTLQSPGPADLQRPTASADLAATSPGPGALMFSPLLGPVLLSSRSPHLASFLAWSRPTWVGARRCRRPADGRCQLAMYRAAPSPGSLGASAARRTPCRPSHALCRPLSLQAWRWPAPRAGLEDAPLDREALAVHATTKPAGDEAQPATPR